MRVPTCFRLWLVLAALPHAVDAQVVEPAAAHGSLVERIRERIADQWEVRPEAVELELGSLPGAATLSEADAVITLLGSGSGGHWVARLESDQGGTESVRIRAGVREESLVAARDLPRGVELGAGDVRSLQTVRWGEPLRDAPRAREGWVTQRLVREGEPLRTPAVQAPMAVRSGEPVSLVWERAGVGLRVSGKAAGSAALGQQVFVRTESGRRLKGTVVAPGVVNVTQGGMDR